MLRLPGNYNINRMQLSLMPKYENFLSASMLVKYEPKIEETQTQTTYIFDTDALSTVHVKITNDGLVTLTFNKQASNEKSDKGFYSKSYQSNVASKQFFLNTGGDYKNTKISRSGDKLTLIVPKKYK